MKIKNLKYNYVLIFIVTFTILCNSSFAQRTFINKEWESTSGNLGAIQRTASTTDAFSNVIVASNIMDASGETDVLLTKYNSEGQLIWQNTFDGNFGGNDYGVKVLTNSNNEIFVACVIEGVNAEDFGILKYSSSGVLVWSYQWNGVGNGIDIVSDIKLDNSGNIYVTGGSEASNGYSDYAIVKLNGAGAFIWSQNYDYNSLHDAPTGIDITSTAVNVTGASASSATNWDYATVQLNPTTGGINSTQRTNAVGLGLDNALAVVSDDNNSIYITGYVDVNGDKNIRTVKFDNSFSLVWSVDYNGQYDDEARSIDVDADGNVYVTGITGISQNDNNFITIKYSSSGTEQWRREYGEQEDVNTFGAKQVVCDNSNHIIVVGTVDYNGEVDFLTISYDSTGREVFIEQYDHNGANDEISDITIDGSNYYITGISTTNGLQESTIVKYSAFYKDQPIVYENGEATHLDDELLIRFNPSSMNTSNTDNYNKTWGYVEDFVNLTAIAEINNMVSFDFGKQECYKIFPNFKSTDSVGLSRSGEPVKLSPYYASLGIILPENSDDSSIIAALNGGLTSVRRAGSNGFIKMHSGPNDPEYVNGNSPSHRSTWQIPDANINIEPAWAVETGNNNIIVGIYDSGINNSHDDISNGNFATSSVTDGYDYYNNNPITTLIDPDRKGHGTVIAGIVGAWRNNNLGIAGVAGGDGNGGVSIHDMKLWHINGPDNQSCVQVECDIATVAGALSDGMSGIVFPQQDVINISWTIVPGNFPIQTARFLIKETIIDAYRSGISIAASSGNDASSNFANIADYPSSFSDRFLMRVGANDATGGRAAFSNGGLNLDVLAPGTNDLYVGLGHNGSDYGYGHIDYGQNCFFNIDGTSFAAPHVAGTMALMHSYNLNNGLPFLFTPEDIEEFVEMNATDLISPPYQVGYDIPSGHGRLNVGETFKSIEFPRYRVEHYETTVESPSYTQVGFQEEVCLEKSFFGLPVGEIKVNRYETNPTFTHTLPANYQLISGWANGSKSDLYGINSGGSVNCLPFTSANSGYLPDAGNPTFESSNLTATGVSMKGYTYELLDANNNTVGWLPKNLNEPAKFHYSLYLLDPSIPGQVGIEEHTDLIFDIYPNPANQSITIELGNANRTIENILIVDLTGRIVKKLNDINTENKQTTISVEDLKPGIYFVKVEGKESSKSKKLIII